MWNGKYIIKKSPIIYKKSSTTAPTETQTTTLQTSIRCQQSSTEFVNILNNHHHNHTQEHHHCDQYQKQQQQQQQQLQNKNSHIHYNNHNHQHQHQHQSDKMSVRSISSEDVSTAIEYGNCCSAEARNPAIKTGRRIQLFQMIILPFIPILALIVQTSLMLHDILNYRVEVSDIEIQVTTATDLGKIVTRLQLERSDVAIFIFTNGNTSRVNLTERFMITDEALDNIDIWGGEVSVPTSLEDDNTMEVMLNRSEFQNKLNNFREKISSEESSITEVMEWYTAINRALLTHMTKQIKETDNSGVWRYLVGFKNLLKSIECQAIASSYGIKYYGRGKLGTEAYVSFIRYDFLAKELLNSTMNYVPSLKNMYKNLTIDVDSFRMVKNWSAIILKNSKIEPVLNDAINYYYLMQNYMEELRKLQKVLREKIRVYVDETLTDASNKEAVGIAILIVVLCVSPIIIVLVKNAAATIQMYAMNLAQKAKELKREKRKSDSLLFQMLPPSVATQLKQTQQVPAECYEAATIYFSDIVGFTEIAAECTPLEVVTFLNSIYKVFDERIECYDVYKVETIGDSYMVASGLPVKNGNKHVTEIATMALDLLDASSLFKIPRRNSETLQIRCGAHTGPVVAGIVGTKMPRYCLFGDTVNTASRMESTGESQKIHITEEMNEALMRVGGYKTEHRGLIDVKGKGLMSTYWLTCKDGPVTVREEISWYADIQPVFLQNIKTFITAVVCELPFDEIKDIDNFTYAEISEVVAVEESKENSFNWKCHVICTLRCRQRGYKAGACVGRYCVCVK
ncbi:uncharacterized protein LOC129605660 [Condylostylus longicornis]|uniref:uncharacterized protein LOC129605660 n=1 Tax=Condylostylus longicornis TaxID=2530218 RepID=UPI00244E43E5|nr:uncharacterized protein LOC129605660 [Condylostylus longicornis]